MRIIVTDGQKEFNFFETMKKREAEVNQSTTTSVLEIIKEVKEKGDEALRTYGSMYDGACPSDFSIPEIKIKEAFDSAEDEFKEALINAKANIVEYHEKQQVKDYVILKEKGIELGMLVRGLDRAGIYVPGGTASYPSTVLMNCIPAKLAGVKEVIMVTPPVVKMQENGKLICFANPDILAAAYVAGVDRIFLTGGAQAIAALTFGTESIPKVDKIVGPGNIYVATAKKLLYGQVDIDMIAGPSEILIIADDTANPKYIAADLMSQAEHDKMAASILLTTNKKIGEETKNEIEIQLEHLERQDIIKSSLEDYGAIIICRNDEEMINLANEIAPEHLEIMMKNPLSVLKEIKNAGSVFCGDFTPEPLGDYYAGTNHVLPTSGTARFSSPLGVYSFVKRMSYTYYTKEALEDSQKDIINISTKEGLFAHGNAIKVRFI